MEHTFDMSRLTRRKPDMSKEAVAKASYRETDELVLETASRELQRKHKNIDLCVDQMRKSGWSEMTFREKVDSLVLDSLYWGGYFLARGSNYRSSGTELAVVTCG